MTRDEERAIEQRTRIRDVRMTLQSIANDAEPLSQEVECPDGQLTLGRIILALRGMETRLGDSYAVRKARIRKEPS